MGAVRNVKCQTSYLSKSLGSADSKRYYFSGGWVFAGWVCWSRWFKNDHGVYPDEKYPGVLLKLSRIPKRVRDMITMPELMRMDGL